MIKIEDRLRNMELNPCDEAADEIERLREDKRRLQAENKELMGSIRKYWVNGRSPLVIEKEVNDE